MAFEIVVVNNTPMTSVSDLDEVAIRLFTHVGYLSSGVEAGDGLRESVPYRLVMDCFIRRPEKAWTIEELMAVLGTSRPTVYRHLNKLKAMDLLEESAVKTESEPAGRKAYRVRYGNVSKAWNFVEANVKVAMENYRRTVDHMHELASRTAARATGAETAPARRAA